MTMELVTRMWASWRLLLATFVLTAAALSLYPMAPQPGTPFATTRVLLAGLAGAAAVFAVAQVNRRAARFILYGAAALVCVQVQLVLIGWAVLAFVLVTFSGASMHF